MALIIFIDADDGDDSLASLYSMFSSMEKVTIESLKAKLSSLPEGQTDLGALLVAAKVDLTVEDIVGPPLTQVKKIMEAKGLSEWQMTLCLKIRRRKKNTERFFLKFFFYLKMMNLKVENFQTNMLINRNKIEGGKKCPKHFQTLTILSMMKYGLSYLSFM